MATVGVQELLKEIRQTVEDRKRFDDRMDGIAAGLKWAEESEQFESLAKLILEIASLDDSSRFYYERGDDEWSAAERIAESISGKLSHEVSKRFWKSLQRVPEKTVSPGFAEGFIMGVSIVLVENTDEAELSESAAD